MQFRHRHELPAQQLTVLSSGFSWPGPVLTLACFMGSFAMGLGVNPDHIPVVPCVLLALAMLIINHFTFPALAALRGYWSLAATPKALYFHWLPPEAFTRGTPQLPGFLEIPFSEMQSFYPLPLNSPPLPLSSPASKTIAQSITPTPSPSSLSSISLAPLASPGDPSARSTISASPSRATASPAQNLPDHASPRQRTIR